MGDMIVIVKEELCEWVIIRKNKQIKSTVHDGNKKMK